MLTFSAIFFALAALLGIFVLWSWLQNRGASNTVIYSHGLAAVTGLTLMLIYVYRDPERFPNVALLLFVLGAVVGLGMFFYERGSGKRPVPLAILHALVGVTGLIVLLSFLAQ